LAAEPFRTVLTKVDGSPLGRKILNKLSRDRGVFRTFDEGWIAARQANPVGHEDPGEIAQHLRYSYRLLPSDYAVLYWLRQIGPDELRVFDYGGNAGNLFYACTAYLQPLRSVDWTVFDIPSVVEEGRKIAAERNAAGLHFTNSVAEVSRSHVLLISGAFHYWEKTIEAFLGQFSSLPEHILISRSPVIEKEKSFITVQRTKSCAFPCAVWNADELIAGFVGQGYTLADRWRAAELGFDLPLFPHLSVPYYSGFYFRRKNL